MSTTHAAHIITTDATALGDPEIIVMTSDEGMGVEEVERIPFGGESWQAEGALAEHGWRVVGPPTDAAVGYYIVNVERNEA